MAEPRTVIEDALDIINGDPLLSAVASFTVSACMVVGGEADATQVCGFAAIIVASRTPPDESTLLSRAQTIGSLAATIAHCDRELASENNAHARVDIETRRATALATLRRVWGERG